jgi:hypothetical protein
MVLAYTPFVDALALHDEWYLLIIPMVVFIGIGYKAVRVPDMKDYFREVVMFVIQVLGGMAILAAIFTLVITVLIPLLAPMPGV